MSSARERGTWGTRTQSRDGRNGGARRDQDRPKAPELITLAISAAIVLALVGAVVYLQLGLSDKPALVDVQPVLEDLQQAGGLYYLPIEVTNQGGDAAEDLILRLSVTYADGNQQTVELNVGFLAAGGVVRAMVALPRDPSEALIEVDTIGYLEAG
jgi:uncharacterized protein (TIGR02588 family)